MTEYSLWQIDPSKDNEEVLYATSKALERYAGEFKPDMNIYKKVFTGSVEEDDLEWIYRKHQKPTDLTFRAMPVSDFVEFFRAMTVSDVVEVTSTDSEVFGPGFYYCDDIGFRKFDKEEEE